MFRVQSGWVFFFFLSFSSASYSVFPSLEMTLPTVLFLSSLHATEYAGIVEGFHDEGDRPPAPALGCRAVAAWAVAEAEAASERVGPHAALWLLPLMTSSGHSHDSAAGWAVYFLRGGMQRGTWEEGLETESFHTTAMLPFNILAPGSTWRLLTWRVMGLSDQPRWENRPLSSLAR